MRRSFLLLLALLLPTSTALAGPVVDEDLVAALPVEERARLDLMVGDLAGLEVALDAAKAERQARLDELRDEKTGVGDARSELSQSRDLADAAAGYGAAAVERARSEVDMAKTDLEHAQADLDQARAVQEAGKAYLAQAKAEEKSAKAAFASAKAERRIGNPEGVALETAARQAHGDAKAAYTLAKADLEEAGAAVAEAKAAVRAAQQQVRVARGEVRGTKDEASAAEVEAEAAIDAQRAGVQAARQGVASADDAVDLARDRIDLLEAERDLAAARLELRRAEVVAANGTVFDVVPFQTATDQASAKVEALRAAVGKP